MRLRCGPICASFEVQTVPGDHLGIMTAHFEALAAVLSRLLVEAPYR